MSASARCALPCKGRLDGRSAPSRVEIPRFAPICFVPINWNAMTKTDITKLDKLRRALLQLHKALLDELAEADNVDDKNGDVRAELRGVIERLRTLVRFEGNDGFTGPYREIVEAVPDALVAHVQLSRLLADFGAAGGAG